MNTTNYNSHMQGTPLWIKTGIIVILFGILFDKSSQAQVKIGTNPNQIERSSLLELESQTEGLLLPRLSDTLAINSLNPPSGMLIYLRKAPNTGVYIRKNGGWDFLNGASNSPVSTDQQTALALKVDKVTGKGLSTEDYTTVEKTKLAGLSDADGSETKVTAGTNVTVTGVGTAASPYVINASGGGSGSHYIGEDFNGGIIYYLYKGSDGLEHGLIVSKTESAAPWQASGILVNANRTDDGAYNTGLMTSSAAASYITTLGAGWYLPSIDELWLLFYNRYSVQKALRTGGFTLLSSGASYWSSTEYDATSAYLFYFTEGYADARFKLSTWSVRGVKAF